MYLDTKNFREFSLTYLQSFARAQLVATPDAIVVSQHVVINSTMLPNFELRHPISSGCFFYWFHFEINIYRKIASLELIQEKEF